MSKYHCDFITDSVQFPPMGHRFVSFAFLEDAQRTRRHIISRMRGSSDTGGASYGRRKPPKLALFCWVPIPEKLEQVFALFIAEFFFVCCVRDH